MGSMSPEIFDGLKLFVAQKIPTLNTFLLKWFGGEPLLEWRRMVDFTIFCRSLCDQHGVSMPAATVPTNAWAMTPEVLEALVSAGISSFMVSLDGTSETHNKTRKLISGRGTFDRIIDNLSRASKTNLKFSIILRLHLHRDNVDYQVELAKILSSHFGGDSRFSLHPITIGDFGGPTVGSMNLFQGDSKYIENQLKNLFRSNDKESKENTGDIYVCYAAKPNHIFVRPSGAIEKCTSALGRSDNIVGKVYPSGELSIDDSIALGWSFGFKSGRLEDLSCPLGEKSFTPSEKISVVNISDISRKPMPQR